MDVNKAVGDIIKRLIDAQKTLEKEPVTTLEDEHKYAINVLKIGGKIQSLEDMLGGKLSNHLARLSYAERVKQKEEIKRVKKESQKTDLLLTGLQKARKALEQLNKNIENASKKREVSLACTKNALEALLPLKDEQLSLRL